MFNKLAAAAIAVSLIAGSALAQGSNVPATGAGQPAVKSDVVKSNAKLGAVHVKKTHRHLAKVKHARHFAHVKHFKHVKHAKHLKRSIKAAG